MKKIESEEEEEDEGEKNDDSMTLSKGAQLFVSASLLVEVQPQCLNHNLGLRSPLLKATTEIVTLAESAFVVVIIVMMQRRIMERESTRSEELMSVLKEKPKL